MDNRPIIGTPLRGKINTNSMKDAEEYAAFKRRQGLRVRLHDRGLYQGRRVYPITVSWWLPPEKGET
jgi:hypothetical protein